MLVVGLEDMFAAVERTSSVEKRLVAQLEESLAPVQVEQSRHEFGGGDQSVGEWRPIALARVQRRNYRQGL